MKPHVVTMSGPDVVRIELHVEGRSTWAETDAIGALGTAWSIGDSAARAASKAGLPFPEAVVAALDVLRSAAHD